MPVVPGLGLIEIGRPWGIPLKPLPTPAEIDALLDTAVDEQVLFWDTAASYGASEQEVGRYLRNRPVPGLTLATKFGDHWTPATAESVMDHSYDALRRSLDRSLHLLPRIDLLQVHRAHADALRSADVYRALDAARAAGIPQFGASVKDMEAARLAAGSGYFAWLQIPFNRLNTTMTPALELGMKIIVNRPFAEGRLIEEGPQPSLDFIAQHAFDGTVIMGTRSAAHLRENARAFYVSFAK